jgi:Mlc titration factor MtfA (ptsG expression regulator)
MVAFVVVALIAGIALASILLQALFSFIIPVIFGGISDVISEIRFAILPNPGAGLKRRYEHFISGKIPYYDALPEKLKIRFLRRIPYFIRDKTFYGREGLEVTTEMKVLVAASAVQLTLGIENFILEKFHTIIFYPEKYLSTITGKYHVGEANIRGMIVISWSDFERGYSDGHDTYNVGLHEMAHALDLDTRSGNYYDDAFVIRYKRWMQTAEVEFDNMQNDEAHFLREYAATNMQEFFAVCIEHFFEASAEFKQNLPELYNELSILLNQDPLQFSSPAQANRINKRSSPIPGDFTT